MMFLMSKCPPPYPNFELQNVATYSLREVNPENEFEN